MAEPERLLYAGYVSLRVVIVAVSAFMVCLAPACVGGGGSLPTSGDGGGDDEGGSGGSSGTNASGGSSGSACTANGAACDNERECCSGFCPGDACAPPNVDFGSACTAPAPCGGDPSGTWTLVGGCGAPKVDCGTPGKGAVTASGTLVVPAGTAGVPELEYDLHACGWVSQGGPSLQPPSSGDAGKAGWPFCVQGSTLWLFPPPPSGPDVYLTALKLTR
jgi:hypothetical protein